MRTQLLLAKRSFICDELLSVEYRGLIQQYLIDLGPNKSLVHALSQDLHALNLLCQVLWCKARQLSPLLLVLSDLVPEIMNLGSLLLMSIFSHKEPWLIVSNVSWLIQGLALRRTIREQVLATIAYELCLPSQSLSLILNLQFELLRILTDELLRLLP